MGRIEWKERVFNRVLECFSESAVLCGDLLWKYHLDLSQQNNSPSWWAASQFMVRYWGHLMFVCRLYYRALKLESVNVSLLKRKRSWSWVSVSVTGPSELCSTYIMACSTRHLFCSTELHTFTAALTWPTRYLSSPRPCDTINYTFFALCWTFGEDTAHTAHGQSLLVW